MPAQAIANLWGEHREAEFPDCRGDEVNGVDLVMLDASVAGCVSYFVSRGRLDTRRHDILASDVSALADIVPQLDGYARLYFARLHTLALAVITEIGGTGGQA